MERILLELRLLTKLAIKARVGVGELVHETLLVPVLVPVLIACRRHCSQLLLHHGLQSIWQGRCLHARQHGVQDKVGQAVGRGRQCSRCGGCNKFACAGVHATRQ